jgi:hypothetical protein
MCRLEVRNVGLINQTDRMNILNTRSLASKPKLISNSHLHNTFSITLSQGFSCDSGTVGNVFCSIATNRSSFFLYPCTSILTFAAGVPSLIVKYPSSGGNDCNSAGITVCVSRNCSFFDTDPPINPCEVSPRIISTRSCFPIKSAITSAVLPSRQFRINFVQVPCKITRLSNSP